MSCDSVHIVRNNWYILFLQSVIICAKPKHLNEWKLSFAISEYFSHKVSFIQLDWCMQVGGCWELLAYVCLRYWRCDTQWLFWFYRKYCAVFNLLLQSYPLQCNKGFWCLWNFLYGILILVGCSFYALVLCVFNLIFFFSSVTLLWKWSHRIIMAVLNKVLFLCCDFRVYVVLKQTWWVD